jgi:hypothetical protein
MSSNIDEMRRKVQDLTGDIKESTVELRQLEALMFRYVALIRRVGLPENMQRGITDMLRLITVIRSVHTSLIMLQAALAATPGIGWLYALAAIGSSAFMASDLMLSMGE